MGIQTRKLLLFERPQSYFQGQCLLNTARMPPSVADTAAKGEAAHYTVNERRADAVSHVTQVCAVAGELAADDAHDTLMEAEEEAELGVAPLRPVHPGSPHPADFPGAPPRSTGSPRRRLSSPRRSAPALTVSRFAFSPPRALRAPFPNPATNVTDSETCTASELGELGWAARPAAGARRSHPGQSGLGLGLQAGHARFHSYSGSCGVFGGGAFGSAAGESGLGSDSDGETDGATSAFEPMGHPGAKPGLGPGPSEPGGGPAWPWGGHHAALGRPDSEAEDAAAGFSTVRSAPLTGSSCGPARPCSSAAAGPSAPPPQGCAAVPGPVQPVRAGASCAPGGLGGALAHAGCPAKEPLGHASSGPGPGLRLEGAGGAALDDDGYQSSSEDSDEPRRGARGARWAWLGRGSSAGSQTLPAPKPNPDKDPATVPRADSLSACDALGAEPGCAAAQQGGGGAQGGTAGGLGWLPTPSIWSSVRQRIARRRASQGGS